MKLFAAPPCPLQGTVVSMRGAALLVVVLVAALPLACRSASDAELLLAFKAQWSNGDTVLSSWSGTDPCSGTWTRITCRNNSVTAM